MKTKTILLAIAALILAVCSAKAQVTRTMALPEAGLT